MTTIIKILGILFVLLTLLLGSTYYYIFGRMQKVRTGPELGHGIEQIADGITTIFMLEAGNGKVVLVDAGNDPAGTPILTALQKRGKTSSDVAAIFITHAHPDHDAAIGAFPNAEIFAIQDEVEVAEGREPYGSPISKIFGAYNPHPFKVTHPLHDGETIKIGSLQVTAYEVSGHTPGSAIYLAQGVLFTGDALGIFPDHHMKGPVVPFSRNPEQGIASLKSFLQKISPRKTEVEFFASSHNGNVLGTEGLQALAGELN